MGASFILSVFARQYNIRLLTCSQCWQVAAKTLDKALKGSWIEIYGRILNMKDSYHPCSPINSWNGKVLKAVMWNNACARVVQVQLNGGKNVTWCNVLPNLFFSCFTGYNSQFMALPIHLDTDCKVNTWIQSKMAAKLIRWRMKGSMIKFMSTEKYECMHQIST